MKTFRAVVRGRRTLSAHLVSLTLSVEDAGDDRFTSTGVPDEYLRLLIPTADAADPVPRVYTVSDHRIVDGRVQIDVDVAIHDEGEHDEGAGSHWARTCEPGDEVELTEPSGLYAAEPGTPRQLLVCDLTGVPALARILRGLTPGQHAEVHVVVTDPADEVPLPSAADVDATWHVVRDERHVEEALTTAVLRHDLSDRPYVWLAGEARASRAVRKHLRRTLGWPQSAFYTCGYWQLDAERWNARYAEVADQVMAEYTRAEQAAAGDEGRLLDALDDIYESVGL